MSVIALNAKTLKSLVCPPGKAKENIWDALCKGLMLEVRQSGGRTWYVRYVDGRGKPRQLRIGGADVISLEKARKRTDELRSQVALGRDPAQEKAALRQVSTLAEFVHERYLPYVKGYKRSWHIDESLLRNHVLPKLGHRYLDQIHKDDIIALHHGHRAKGRAPASANRLLILLRYIYNLALRWETPGVLKNPTQNVPLLEENNKRERYLTQDEAQRLYRAVQRSESRMLRFIVPMLILTGARKREVLDARWSEFDRAQRVWRITLSKSGKARFVPLSDAVLTLLVQLQAEHDSWPDAERGSEWAFVNPVTSKPYSSIYYTWDHARKLAGLPEVRVHDLRHSFASFLINAGRSIYEVQKILGHTQLKTTQRYSHLSQDTLLAAMNTAVVSLPGFAATVEEGEAMT
jgi:integrase